MVLIEQGKVQGGRIVFPKPLELPEGTEVLLHIHPLGTETHTLLPGGDEDSSFLPFFGMWADREDMRDSSVWLQKEREQWHQRQNQPG